MRILLQVFTILATTVCIALGATRATPSAGHCGTTSVPNVPGCWGQPVMMIALIPFTQTLTLSWKGCAYVIATDLGGGAACKYDYCSMSGLSSSSLKVLLLKLASIRLRWHQCSPFARDSLWYHDNRLRELDDPAIVKSLSNGLANHSWKLSKLSNLSNLSKACADFPTQGRNGRDRNIGWDINH